MMERAWIAARDSDVEAALTHPDLHVRPPAQRIPAAMHGTPLGDIFRRLARMNDGALHDRERARIEALLRGWDDETLIRYTQEAVRVCTPRDIAGYVVAKLIGIEDAQAALPSIARFAAALAGGASEADIAQALPAATFLLEHVPHPDDADLQANMIGFLFQAYAATANLIHAELDGTGAPPVVMTRRWAARDLVVGETSLRAGDMIVVLLTSPRFRFGAGPHRCPGERIAATIADAAIAALKSDARRASAPAR